MTLHIDSRNYMQLHYDYGIQCRPSTQHKLDSLPGTEKLSTEFYSPI